MLQRKKLASAVAIAVGASAVALGTAQAGTILFPQIAVSPTITTIISVMNAGDGFERAIGETLHYRYFWKPWLNKSFNADDPNTIQVENKCIERNRYLPTSKNDLQTFDVGGVAFGSAGRGVMFLDESVNNDWDKNPVDYRLGDEATLVASGGLGAHRAYLLVDNDSTAFWGPDLAGEAILVDVAVGATWGYQAFQNQRSEDYEFDRFASARYSLVPYMPTDEVTTRFVVTVLDGEFGDDMSNPAAAQNTAHIGVRVVDGVIGEDGDIVAGVYDRDENFNSGGVDRPVTCLGAWDIEDLYPDALFTTPGGGWTNVTNYEVDYDTNRIKAYFDEQEAAVFKVEYGSSIDGTGLGGVYNNGLYLHPDMEYAGRSEEVLLVDETVED
jgi:hypothetical protein